MLAEGTLEGVLADGPGLVGMGEVEIELAPELVRIAVGDDLLAGFEQGRQLVLPAHDLARAARGQLEGPGVNAHDVVHRVMVVQRQRRARVDRELGAPPHGRARDHPPDPGVGGVPPARSPQPHRVSRQLPEETLAIRVVAPHEGDGAGVAIPLLRGQRHRMVHRRDAVHGEVMEVGDPDLLEAPERIALFREEHIIRLDALERDHPERVVGEEIDDDGVQARLDAPDHARRDRPSLDDQDHLGPPVQARALQPPQDPELVGLLGADILVERVVPPVGEGAHLVAQGEELVPEVHAHVLGALERQHDQPAHGLTLTPGHGHTCESSSKYRSRLILAVLMLLRMIETGTARYVGITTGRATPGFTYERWRKMFSRVVQCVGAIFGTGHESYA